MSCNLKSLLYAGTALLAISTSADALDMQRVLRYIDNHPDVAVKRNSASALEQATFSLSREYNEFIKPVTFEHRATILGNHLITKFRDIVSGNDIEAVEYGGNLKDREDLDDYPEKMRMYLTFVEQTKKGLVRKRTGESSDSPLWDKETKKRIIEQYQAILSRTDTEAKTFEEKIRKESKHKKHKKHYRN